MWQVQAHLSRCNGKNVHNLKEHKFMCTKCSEEFNDKKQIYIHKKSHSQEKLQKKNMKCKFVILELKLSQIWQSTMKENI